MTEQTDEPERPGLREFLNQLQIQSNLSPGYPWRSASRNEDLRVACFVFEWTYRMKLPRFSIRTLAIVVTLICAYFATWKLTDTYGVVRQVGFGWSIWEIAKYGEVYYADSPAPLVVRGFEPERGNLIVERYYLWLGATTVRLPLERIVEYEELELRIFGKKDLD